MRAPFAIADDPQVRLPSDLNEETIKMSFPRRVMLTLQDYSHMTFEPGIRDVPMSLADPKTAQGQYLHLNGVREYTGPVQPVATNPLFVELAHDLWKTGELEQFAAYIHDPKILIAGFEKEARIAQLKRDAESKAEATRVAQARETARIQADEESQKRNENAVADATESARTGRPVDEIKAEREAKESGLPSAADLDLKAQEQKVVAAAAGNGKTKKALPIVEGR